MNRKVCSHCNQRQATAVRHNLCWTCFLVTAHVILELWSRNGPHANFMGDPKVSVTLPRSDVHLSYPVCRVCIRETGHRPRDKYGDPVDRHDYT